MIAAIVLAAGASTRMGTAKALLPDLDGRPFAVRLARTCALAEVDTIVVVSGREHEALAAALGGDPLASRTRVVRNPDPSRGQISSLWVGLDAVDDPELAAVLVTPVDVPLTDQATVAGLVQAWRATGRLIVRPSVGNRHGHPVLFDRRLFGELRHAGADGGAKTVLRAHAQDILNVPVDDEWCLVDIDTPSDYQRLIARSL